MSTGIDVLRTVAFAVFLFACGGWFATFGFATFAKMNKRAIKEQERHPYRPIAQCTRLDCVYHDLSEAGFDCTCCRIFIDREGRCGTYQKREKEGNK